LRVIDEAGHAVEAIVLKGAVAGAVVKVYRSRMNLKPAAAVSAVARIVVAAVDPAAAAPLVVIEMIVMKNRIIGPVLLLILILILPKIL